METELNNPSLKAEGWMEFGQANRGRTKWIPAWRQGFSKDNDVLSPVGDPIKHQSLFHPSYWKIKLAKAEGSVKDYFDVLPVEICQWAENILEKEVDESCMDNYRVANIRKSCQMKRYKRTYKHGCCGFFDEKRVCPIDGNTYLIGCNYGH